MKNSSAALAKLTHLAVESLRPAPLITVSQWATKYRKLRKDYAKEPGDWRPERTPFLVEPMDKLSVHDPCREVVTLFPSQVGKTTIGENWLGYIVDVAPGPTMFVQPTDDDCADWVDSRIQPMIEDCPSLLEKFDKSNDPDGVATKLKKGFRGGTVYFKGTNSSSKSRSKSIRYLLLDEEDAFKVALAKDGNPVKLFEARTTTFGAQAKIYKSSTPTDEATSRIWQDYLSSDQHKYWVPLPCCGTMQLLEYRHLCASHKTPNNVVAYRCPHCGCYVLEHAKNDFLVQGKWALWIEQEGERQAALDLIGAELGAPVQSITWEIVNHPIWMQLAARTNGKKVGYWLNGLYSPFGWLSWNQILDEHAEAKEDLDSLQAWVNTRMAEVWTGAKGEKIEESTLTRLCIPYTRSVPDPIVTLTLGGDVQKDRIEAIVAGWEANRAPWHVDHRIIYGDPEGDDIWEELDRCLLDSYEGLRIAAACIDSGYLPDRTYRFCRQRFARNVWATKGSTNPKDPIFPFRATLAKGKHSSSNLYLLGVHQAKKRLMERLHKGPDDAGCFHFRDDWEEEYRDEYFAQLTAETLVPHKRAGVKIEEWVKTRPRNEVLDAWVYAYAALVGLIQNGYRPHVRRQETQSNASVTTRPNNFLERRAGWFK
jgi:phage terminase large subunit GpA-like protein